MKAPEAPALILAIGFALLPMASLVGQVASPSPPGATTSAFPSPTAIPSSSNPPNRTPPPTSPPPFAIPAPDPAPTIARAAPPAPGPVSGPPSALDLQQLTPVVQVWRSDSLTPELPVRRGRYLSPVLIAPSESVIVRLQFGPLARGKSVMVRPGPGVTINPSQQVFVLPSTADCAMSVTLDQSFLRGAISFYCEGLVTTLPLGRGVSAVPLINQAAPGGAR